MLTSGGDVALGEQYRRCSDLILDAGGTAMAQPSKEPCKKHACDIQACLSKNNFLPKKCLKFIQALQYCCEQCEYKSTHCASVSGLLKQIQK